MKKIKIFIAASVIAAASLLSPATATAASTKAEKSNVSLVEKIPVNIIVKQTAKLKDGRSVIIYYKKDGDFVEIFSSSNLKGYKPEDLLNLESTDFSLASSVAGTSIYRCPISTAKAIFKQLVNTYL